MSDEILSEDGVMDTFYTVLLPAIIKYQAPSTSSPLGKYLLTLALNYSISEVWFKVFYSMYKIAKIERNYISRTLCHQVLHFVNPNCMYVSPNGSKRPQPAVAIVLKRLLHALTRIGMDHADESSIRLQLRKRSDCKTTANQYFLVKGSTSKKMGNNTKNTSCVIIPRSDVPERFFQIIEGYSALL